METLGKIIFAVFAAVGATIIGGFVFQHMWAWFIVPAFNLQIISFGAAIGISFFISYIRIDPRDLTGNDEGDFVSNTKKNLLSGLTKALITLGLGYSLHYYIQIIS